MLNNALLMELSRPPSREQPVDIYARNNTLRSLVNECHPGLIQGPVPDNPATIAYQNEQMLLLLMEEIPEDPASIAVQVKQMQGIASDFESEGPNAE